jgi:hypothetical protein
MNYQSLTKAELIKELERLKKVKKPKPRITRTKPARKPDSILAGCDIEKDDLLVVDEEKNVAWVHPEVKTVANKIRIHGYAVRSFRKGQVVRIRHWLNYEPK